MTTVADCNVTEYYGEASVNPDKLTLLRSFYGCLANALHYVRSMKIRHRDVKPENILVKSDQVYLTDFGTSDALPENRGSFHATQY
jgi:serine/threonine protein kinase